MREFYGEPDIIQVRKIFNTEQSAYTYEQKVLRRLAVLNDEKWLNKCIGGKYFSKNLGYRPSEENIQRFLTMAKEPKSESSKSKNSLTNKARAEAGLIWTQTLEGRNHLSKIKSDTRYRIVALENLKKANQRKLDKRKESPDQCGRYNWYIVSPSGEEFYTKNIVRFCEDRNLCLSSARYSKGRVVKPSQKLDYKNIDQRKNTEGWRFLASK